ncbi:MAG: hypothetical protein J5973_02240 [Eubacterium sp.]|nr:hypothetical protein [Eubacterium sp.]
MRRNAKAILIALILAAAALLAAASYFLYSFYIPDEQVEVVGNLRYSDAEIRRMAMPGFKEHNSLYLRFFRNEIDLADVPYIDSIEVEYLGPGRVRLHANEEYPVGYLLYDGYRYYFNASGVVTEILEDAALRQEEKAYEEESDEPEAANGSGAGDGNNTVLMPVSVAANGREDAESDTSFRPALTDVSQVSGLTDKAYSAGEQIPVDHTGIFRTLMDLGKLCNKLSIRPDEIHIVRERTFTLRYDEVLVKIGTDTLLDEKMSRAAAILPQLEGKKGILHLERFSPDTINIIFSANEEDTEEKEAAAEEAAAEQAAVEEAAAEQAAAEQAAAELAAAEETGNTGSSKPAEENGSAETAGNAGETEYTENTGTEEIPWDETWDAVWGAGNEAVESE